MIDLYSAGPCPICSDHGAAIYVRARQSGVIFLLCPSCGVAWTGQAPSNVRDFKTPRQMAPDGVALPGFEEILASTGCNVFLNEVSSEYWMEQLSEFLDSD